LKKNIFWTIFILLLPFAIFAAVFFSCKGEVTEIVGNVPDRIAASERIRELAGYEYEGRQFGTPGGEKASEYIKSILREQGIESPYEEGYGIGFDATSALYKSAEFNILDIGDGVSETFDIFKDYNPAAKGLGGGIDYFGDVLLAEGPVENIPGYMLVGRLAAVKSGEISEEAQNHVLRSGGEGILFYDENQTHGFEIERKSVDASGKHSQTVFMARISGGVYDKLQKRAENGFDGIADGVEIHVEIGFPYLRGENIIGYIPAEQSDECLIFAAGYDGYGSYGENGHVPCAIDNAGGISGLLELSGKLGAMDSVPETNIVFLFFDGEKSGTSGIVEYFENPLFPFDKTEVVLLDKLGWKNSEKTWISYVNGDSSSERLADIIFQNYENAGLKALTAGSEMGASQKSLYEMEIPAVTIGSVSGTGFETIGGTPKDNGGQWDGANFEENMEGCADFAIGHCYKTPYLGHIDTETAIFSAVLFALLYLSYAAGVLHVRHPGASIGGSTIRKIYHSLPRMLLGRFTGLLISVSAAIAVIVLASNIRFLDLASLNLAFEGMYSFMRNFEPDKIADLIGGGLALSTGLAASSMALAFIAGITAGTWRGAAAAKGSEGRGMFSLSLLSIPQPFWALAFLYVSILLFGTVAYSGGGFDYSFKTLALPVFSMAVIPFACLSLVVERFVKEEVGKDYVLAARARGFGTFEIASRHMLKGILSEAAKFIPQMVVMTLSNLIAVEYIFGLPGLMNRFLVEIESPETVFGAMLLTGAFCAFSALFSTALHFLLTPKGGC